MRLTVVAMLAALSLNGFADSCMERLDKQRDLQNNGSDLFGKTSDIFEKAGSGIFKNATGKAATASILLVTQEIANGETTIPESLDELSDSSLFNSNAKRFLKLKRAYEGYEGSIEGLTNVEFAQKIIDLDTKLDPATGYSVFCKVNTVQNGRKKGQEKFSLRSYSKKKIAQALILN